MTGKDDPFEGLPDLPVDDPRLPGFYDRQGNRISFKDAARLKYSGDRTYHIVAKTQVGDIEVSTVWLGQDHNWLGGPPLIFETMCFRNDGGVEDYQERYPTEEAALAGHDRAVMWARDHER